MRFLRFAICLLFAACSLTLFSAEEPFTADLNSDLYDIQLPITASKPLPDNSLLSLVLEAGENGDALLVTISPRFIYLASRQGIIKKGYKPDSSENRPGFQQ